MVGDFRRSKRIVAIVAFIVSAIFFAAPALQAHETDQYSVPAGREMADLRLWFSRDVHGMVSRIVEGLNYDIESTLDDGRPTSATQAYYDPDTIARRMLLQWPPVIVFIEIYEGYIHARSMQEEYPGLVVGYRPSTWIYHHPMLIINPTKITRLKRCSTIMVDGVYFGTDKLAHFVHMGYIYYSQYRKALAAGKSEAEAVRDGWGIAVGSNLFFSENALLGRMTTGVRSNGDLASNYCGFKFYRNLIEPVMLRGRMQPPLMVRDGVYWRVNDHVQPNSDFFAQFVSPHWDEVLNPNEFGFGIGTWVKSGIKNRCGSILDFYRDEHGRMRTQDEFAQLTREMSTYYGEPYGHFGPPESLIQVANTCFEDDGRPIEAIPAGEEALAVASGEPASTKNTGIMFGRGSLVAAKRNHPSGAADSLGRTALWWAAWNGDSRRVNALLASSVDVNAPDIDGETPLHCAARWGFADIADALLQARADANFASRSGMTPLHLAVREMRTPVVALLLKHGAKASAADSFGVTPLHDAAAKGCPELVRILLSAGASAGAADAGGTTPLHRAARSGAESAVKLLLENGADVTARNAVGRTAADDARDAGFEQVAESIRGMPSTKQAAARDASSAAKGSK